MNRYHIIFLSFLILPIMQSCVAKTTQSVKRHDTLIGKIIESKTGQQIDFNALIQKISNYDVIYLSEKHDNADQHASQQKVINALVENTGKKGLTPSIGFEFFSMDDTSDLLNFVDAKKIKPHGKIENSEKIEKMFEDNLRMKLGWHTQPDTMWQYYYDLLKIAKEKKLQVAGIDLSSSLKKRITKKGINGITDLEKDQIFSTNLSDINYENHMHSIFKKVHCGMGSKKMQSRLYDTWLARNDKMAHSISRMHTHGKGPVIVIVGSGHTEYNLGIIDRVNAINKDIRQVNIALTEISIKPSRLADYLIPLELDGHNAVPVADFLWFTQRVSYANPCEQFKKSLEKMKKKGVSH